MAFMSISNKNLPERIYGGSVHTMNEVHNKFNLLQQQMIVGIFIHINHILQPYFLVYLSHLRPSSFAGFKNGRFTILITGAVSWRTS